MPERGFLELFEKKARLLPDGAALIESQLRHVQYARAGSDVAKPDSRSAFVIGGWLGRNQDLKSGHRQLVDLCLPGEMMFFNQSAQDERSYVCLTDVQYVDVTEVLLQAEADPSLHPDLTAAFHAFSADVERRLVEQVVRIGAMRAVERMADLALDLYERLDAAALAIDDCFPMALSQEQLGNLLGISAVHVNRTLQYLRQMKLIKTEYDRWKLLDRDRLRALVPTR
ncbi:MAG TPA: Crp/Fnr family transcriptional regulator [Rhizomicrobium sp.]|nr:Crp/Fnr family transcriptional regulator [Rhizomicrobium sp.]